MDALLTRQDELQQEAAQTVACLRLTETLGSLGRVVPLGSAVTGLMVWRDLDFAVDAPGIAPEAVWDAMQGLLVRCSSLRYEHADDERHYYVVRVEGWKIDVTIWHVPMPTGVEAFQADLTARLTGPLRLTILRLKEGWHDSSLYPDAVSAWQIYDAVLHHDVETLDELDAYLAARGFPTRD
jgi:hypothetical protein